MTKEFATSFANQWVSVWNAHDLDAILLLYSEDFTIESPLALQLYPQSGGLVVGKSEVRKYWTIGMQRNPDLKFEVLDIFLGVNSIGLYLFNSGAGKKCIELMIFNEEGKVNKAIVTYLQ